MLQISKLPKLMCSQPCSHSFAVFCLKSFHLCVCMCLSLQYSTIGSVRQHSDGPPTLYSVYHQHHIHPSSLHLPLQSKSKKEKRENNNYQHCINQSQSCIYSSILKRIQVFLVTTPEHTRMLPGSRHGLNACLILVLLLLRHPLRFHCVE